MSIYATLWEIQVRTSTDEWVEVVGQGVPGHIGHPAPDPFADFLPPVVEENEDTLRAVVIVLGDETKEGQRYVDPLLTLSGDEYERTPFGELLARIESEVEERV